MVTTSLNCIADDRNMAKAEVCINKALGRLSFKHTKGKISGARFCQYTKYTNSCYLYISEKSYFFLKLHLY